MCNYDKDLIRDILNQVSHALETIRNRFKIIKTPEDFFNSETGREKLDSICMQLIAIGESIKNVDKITHQSLLKKYPEIDWKKVKGIRDILSHHYFDLDAEVVFDVCKNHLNLLLKTINEIINNLS